MSLLIRPFRRTHHDDEEEDESGRGMEDKNKNIGRS